MKVYINSRGYRQAEDYHWQEIGNQGERRVSEPPIISQFSHLINRENFSVLLAFSQNQLLLLITALEPQQSRADTKGRIIRNSLALVGNYSDEENLRSIAVSALRNELNQKLEDILEFGGSEGFRVKVNLNDLLSQLITGTVNNSPPNRDKRIQPLSPKNQDRLAKELQNHRLPRKNGALVNGALVVVTESVLKSTLNNGNVWRGLTSNFDSGLPKRERDQRNQTPNVTKNVTDFMKSFLGSKNTQIFFLILIVIALLRFVSPQIWGWIGSLMLFNNGEQPQLADSQIVASIASPQQNITVKVGEPLVIEGVFATQFEKKKDAESNHLIEIKKGDSSLQIETISASIDNNNQLIIGKDVDGLVDFNPENNTWKIEISFQDSGHRTINLIGKDSAEKEIVKENIAINVIGLSEKTNELICTVGLENQNLNVFLVGDNIDNQKEQLKVYMFAGTQSRLYNAPPVKVETPNLLKYQDFDGEGSPNQNSRYTIVAGFNNITPQTAKDKANKTKNCNTKATGNPCVICYE